MEANFTPRSQEILALAKKLAEKFNHAQVTIDHLILSFLKADSFLIPLIEFKVKTDFTCVEELVVESLSKNEINTNDAVEFSREVKDSLDYAHNLSSSFNHSYISVEHILYALLNDVSSNFIDYLLACDIDVVEMQDVLDEILNHDITSDPKILTNFSPHNPSFTASGQANATANAVDSYSVDLNELAKEGKYQHLLPKISYIKKLKRYCVEKLNAAHY